MAQYQTKIDVKFEGKRVYTPFALRNTEKDARLLAEKILRAALTDETGVEKVRLTLPDGTKYYPTLDSLTGEKVTVTAIKNPRVAKQQYLAVKISAPNDSNGNARRGWLIFVIQSGIAKAVDFVNEGVYGDAALRDKTRGYPNAIELVDIGVAASVYSLAKKSLLR